MYSRNHGDEEKIVTGFTPPPGGGLGPNFLYFVVRGGEGREGEKNVVSNVPFPHRCLPDGPLHSKDPCDIRPYLITNFLLITTIALLCTLLLNVLYENFGVKYFIKNHLTECFILALEQLSLS